MTCPKCDHGEWKLASLVFAEGIQTIDTRTSSSGIGAGTGGIGIGVGFSSTSGSQQTALSQKAAPPEKTTTSGPSFGAAFAFAVFGFGFLWGGIADFHWKAILLGLACLLVPGITIVLSVDNLREEKEHEDALSRWRSQKMCTRCGYLY